MMNKDGQLTGNLSRREFVGLSAAAAATLAAMGIAPGQVLAADAATSTVIVKSNGDPQSWCPSVTADDNAYNPCQNMFHRLTKMDAGKKAIPDAAESWDVSEDALTITFHLRQDLKWSDGEPLTSADVVYTFDTIKNNAAYYLSSNLQNVESFEAPDDYTVVFNMVQPDMSIVSNIGWYAGFILPEHIYNIEGVDWLDNDAAKLLGTPVTSGPYKLGEYVQGQSITLVANEEYYHVPAIKNLIYSIISDDTTAVQAVQNAEIDVLETVPTEFVDQLLADPSLNMVTNEYPSPVRIIFNCARSEKHLDDPAVRRAICMCIDRESISQKACSGIMPPETHFYPSLYSDYSNDVDVAPEYDPEGAKAVLEEAGYTPDADGNYITGLTLDAFDTGVYGDCARLIVAEMAAIGLPCELIMSESNAWSDKVGQQKNFDIEIQGGFMGPDAYALKQRLGSGTASNYGSYSNPEFDELLDTANATPDDATRQDLYKQAQTILAQDLPYVPIVGWMSYDAYAVGLINTPQGRHRQVGLAGVDLRRVAGVRRTSGQLKTGPFEVG